MKLLFDFFPIVLFFIAFKFAGIYIATIATMIAACLQVSIYWLKYRRFEILHIITLVTLLILGGSTLLLHNELFIKWKPTAIYWIFALTFLGSHFIGEKLLIQRLLDKQIKLPLFAWQRLNTMWIVFFVLMGTLNLYVVYHFNTNVWVNFKLFGTFGLSLVFLVIQGIYLQKSGYLNAKSPNTD